MHTVELLEQSLAVAERLGYKIRQEWLGGEGGGVCQFAGHRWLFLDVVLTAADQLDQVIEALKADPAVYTLELSSELRELLHLRKAA